MWIRSPSSVVSFSDRLMRFPVVLFTAIGSWLKRSFKRTAGLTTSFTCAAQQPTNTPQRTSSQKPERKPTDRGGSPSKQRLSDKRDPKPSRLRICHLVEIASVFARFDLDPLVRNQKG